MNNIKKDVIEEEEDIDGILEATGDPDFANQAERVEYITSLNAAGGLPTDSDSNEFMAVLEDLKGRYPGEEIYYSFIPFNGYFAYRKQYMSDLEFVENSVMNLTTSLISEFRKKNLDAINATRARLVSEKAKAKNPDPVTEDEILRGLPEEVRMDYSRIDGAIEDASVLGIIERCVLYPYDIAERIEEKRIATGIPQILTSYIMRISGWVRNVSIMKG